MPVRPDHYATVPVPLEPPVKAQLEALVKKTGMPRAKLLRMFTKYALAKPDRLKEIMENGDPEPTRV